MAADTLADLQVGLPEVLLAAVLGALVGAFSPPSAPAISPHSSPSGPALLGASRLVSSVLGASVLGAGASAFGLFAVRLAYLRWRRGKTLPREYRPFSRALPVQGRETDAVRDTFKPRKVPDDLDAIVIGSGISGLYLAASLARVGKRVLVVRTIGSNNDNYDV